MRLKDCLPYEISCGILPHINNLRELRLRANQPLRINIDGIWYYLTRDGACTKSITDKTLCVDQQQISQVIINACNKSVYSVEKQLTEGYLTLEDGCRIGVCGTVSRDNNGNVVCFSKFNSVCIRVARSVVCSAKVIDDSQLLNNLLIIGKPSAGKTTFLRDLCARASKVYNVVVVDERGELASCQNSGLDNADVLSFGTKSYALNIAVRSLSPDILAVDELVEQDYFAINNAISSGVCLYATLHGDNIECAKKLTNHGVYFDKYIILGQSTAEKPKVFSKNDIL